MAGSGRRTFAPGEVLTASNVMNYLQDQAVMNFAGTAARGSAIGTAVAEGMVSYLADTNDVQVYDGSVWRSVTGLTPIIPTSVAVGTGSFSIGQNGKVSFTTVGTSLSLNGVFTSAFEHYKIIFSATYAAANVTSMRFRASGTDRSSSLYDWAALVADATGPRQVRSTASANITIGVSATTLSFDMTVFQPASASIPTRVESKGFCWTPTSSANIIDSYGGYSTAGTDDGFSILPAGSNFTGTVQVFGLS